MRRDLRLATALNKYPAVKAALDTGFASTVAGDTALDDSVRVALNQGQAAAIVSALEKVPPSALVPVEDLRVAEEAMVEAAATLPPGRPHAR